MPARMVNSTLRFQKYTAPPTNAPTQRASIHVGIKWPCCINISGNTTAAKAAINGMTRTLARELGEHGIRVNSVVPGAINTERQASLWRSPEIDRQIMENQALKVALDGSHVARMGLFLASDEANGLTGQNFLVDAGMTLN